MKTASRTEAHIITTNTILVVLSKLENEVLVKDLCGSRIGIDDVSSALFSFSKRDVYLCGNISKADKLDLRRAERVSIIKELSHCYSDDEGQAGPEIGAQSDRPIVEIPWSGNSFPTTLPAISCRGVPTNKRHQQI